MALPWLTVVDTLIDVANLALTRKSRKPSDELDAPAAQGRSLGQLETRMTGVVVAALKEAFDRDARRLELERDHLDAERMRAERTLKLELLRQAGEREIGRLRLLAGVAIGSLVGTLLFSTRLIGGPVSARIMLGAGWALLLVALSLSFTAQSQVGRALARIDDPAARVDDLTAGAAAAFLPWLIVLGLALIGLAVLMV